MRRVLLSAAALAAGVALATLPAQGARSATPDVPSGAVVRVGDATISRVTFARWLRIAARSATGPRRNVSYRPPRFADCVARERNVQRNVRPRPTTARLRRGCKTRYEGLRDQVLQFLILERWVAGEAAELGIGLSPQERDSAFEQAKRDTFPNDADFRQFLRDSAMTVADARFQIAFNTLYTKLRESALAAIAPVTDGEVADFYARNPGDFERPQLRDVRVVLTKTRTAAIAVRKRIERGQTWRHVAGRYSIDAGTRRKGGLLLGVRRGPQDNALDAAIFRAPRGKLRGPVKGRFGYWVFKVLKIAPPVQETLAAASNTIREQLTAERQLAAANAFDGDLRTKWKPRTSCRTGFVSELCAGAPDALGYVTVALAPPA